MILCPADEAGAWVCELPAGTYDLAISADGFAPIYRKRISVSPNQDFPLGELVLERGGAIAGWVAVEDGAIDPDACVARLEPVAAGGASLSGTLDFARTSVEQKVSPEGLIHFTGLTPGSYQLRVTQPGYPSVRTGPLRVEAAAESFLPDPLVLRRPVALAFEVSPPLDWLGRAWRARVQRIDTPPTRPIPIVFDGKVEIDGRFLIADQRPGRYRVQLLDSLENRWEMGEQEMGAADPAPRLLEVEWISLEGTVRLGSEPLSASLWFGGRSGSPSIKVDSDEKGRFQGVLPRSGLWQVEVEATEPAVQAWSRTDVRAGHADKAKVEIELPDARVFGRVLDAENKPAARAVLLLEGATVDQLQATDEAGQFAIRGLPEGQVWLAAESSSPAGVSDRTLVDLVEGRTTGPIELRLRPLDRLTGKILSPSGPVGGARVLLLSRSSSGGGGNALSEADGTFLAEVANRTPLMTAIVSAPGFALQSFEVSTEAQPLALTVSSSAGRLRIVLPKDVDEMGRRGLTLLVLQDGLALPTNALLQWAYDQGQPREAVDGSLTIPNVAPGDYRACLLPRQLAGLLGPMGIPEGAPCSSGSLAAGGTLELSLPRAR